MRSRRCCSGTLRRGRGVPLPRTVGRGERRPRVTPRGCAPPAPGARAARAAARRRATSCSPRPSGAAGRALRVAPWGVHVWPPGVDLERFTPATARRARAQRLGIEPTARSWPSAYGAWSREWGSSTLLDAWARSQHELPTGSTLLIVGEGPLRRARSSARAPAAGAGRAASSVARPRLATRARRRLPRRRRGRRPERRLRGLRAGRARGRGLRHAEHRHRRRRPARGRRAARPLARRPARRSRALAARLLGAARASCPAREQRVPTPSASWSTARRAPPRALRRALARRERDARPRVVYLDHVARLSGGEIALLRLLPHLRARRRPRDPRRGRAARERLNEAASRSRCWRSARAARDLRKDSVGGGGGAVPWRAASHAPSTCSASRGGCADCGLTWCTRTPEVRCLRRARREARRRPGPVAPARPHRRGLSAPSRRASHPRC